MSAESALRINLRAVLPPNKSVNAERCLDELISHYEAREKRWRELADLLRSPLAISSSGSLRVTQLRYDLGLEE